MTRARAVVGDDYAARVEVETECKRIRAYVAGLGMLNVLEEVGRRHDSRILVAARDRRLGTCPGCVVAAGLYQAMQAAAGLALPSASSIEIEVEAGDPAEGQP